jgi:hypothetical protein
MLRRTFSVDEANAALPEARRLTERVVERSRRLPELHEELRIRTYRAHRFGAPADLADSLRNLGRAGVDLKGAMEGVVDFPSIREGRVVELCWRVGEPEVTHWHPVGGGFRSRHRLP